MADRKKNWSVADAARSIHGLMVCSCCNKPISEGLYRVRDAGDRFITHHKQCTRDWAGWKGVSTQTPDEFDDINYTEIGDGSSNE